MSKNSTPGHSSSPYDPYYDPEFTAEISAKMHVPEKILLIEGYENNQTTTSAPEEVKSMMHVPDRIIVAGDNKHIAVRDSVPELKFESTFPVQMPNYVLAPPPNVLTVDEYPYPSVEFKAPKKPEPKKKSAIDQTLTGINDMNESSISSSYGPEEEVAILRRQVRHLSRRVLTIEQENQQRQQREIILYALGITYFLFKGLIWLHKHF